VLTETISELITRLENDLEGGIAKGGSSEKSLEYWYASIAALENILLSTTSTYLDQGLGGLIISLPTSVIRSQTLLTHLQIAIFSPKQHTINKLPACQGTLLDQLSNSILELPMHAQDPLARERCALAVTPHFCLVVLYGAEGFQFSFNPLLVEQVWLKLKDHLLKSSENLQYLEALVEKINFKEPDYQLVVNFSRQLLQNIPQFVPSKIQAKTLPKKESTNHGDLDIQLLQALTHEVRTPLTTIRTLTQLLLKRIKPSPEISKHLEVIEQECTAQINRMELIFKAAQLKTTTNIHEPIALVPISLEQVLQECIPRWQQQSHRRQVNLEVSMPHKLPAIVTNPAVLDQMLTNLIDQFIRNLPAGGQIQVNISTAGSQLKLRFKTNTAIENSFFKSLGKLLVFQPETGNLTINHNVTKNIFRSLGGRFTVRHRQGQGEVLTIFLPLGS